MQANKLRARMAEVGLTQRLLAEKIGMSENSFSAKINETRDFTLTEIKLICEALKISTLEERAFIFLT